MWLNYACCLAIHSEQGIYRMIKLIMWREWICIHINICTQMNICIQAYMFFMYAYTYMCTYISYLLKRLIYKSIDAHGNATTTEVTTAIIVSN